MKKMLRLMAMLALSARAENVDPTLSEVDVSSGVPAATIPLRIVHPREGASLPSVSRSFVYGWAEPGGALTVNGATVPMHPGGGWLAMTDYSPGSNVIHVSYAKEGVSVAMDRRVFVGGGNGGGPGPDTLRPSEDLGVSPGELVSVSFRGPEGG